MNMKEIIDKKKNKIELSKEEIEYFIQNYTNNKIPDYQASALVMAIYLNGMTENELTYLTMAMANSGEKLDLSELGNVVDKHSTGGVGDKVTLILIPIIASLGIPVAKMSGRGLGFTGGTADKIEAIPGYKTMLTQKEFIQNVQKIGVSLITQTSNLAPADKKIYALRDSISCTDSIPLIASSIMSKKIASGANKIVLDVTCGSGAFMKNKEEAIELSKQMEQIGEKVGKETVCVITNMEEPLGYSVGNNLEIIETINFLQGRMQEDVKKVVLEIGSQMIKLSTKKEFVTSKEERIIIPNEMEEKEEIKKYKEQMLQVIQNGKAFEKFKQLVKNQGGDISYLEDVDKFTKAQYIEPIYSSKSGIVDKLDAGIIGKTSCKLGAGRNTKEDNIDMSAGITLEKKVGSAVEKGEILAYLHTNKKEIIKEAKEEIEKAYNIK